MSNARTRPSGSDSTEGVSEEEVKTAYMNVFLQFRSAILILNVTPYIALKVMA